MVLCTSTKHPGLTRVVLTHTAALLAILASPFFITGCGGASAAAPITPTPIAPPPVTPTPVAPPPTNPAVKAVDLYSIDLGSQSVDVYAANGNGVVSPTSSYPGGATTVTGDAAGNLYVGTYSSTLTGVVVYPAGSMTAARNLTVATATVNSPQISTMAVDSTGDLYVAISGAIDVYGPTATGTAAPIRTIGGALTTLGASTQVTQMAFDAANNLYVATGAGFKGSQIIEFPAGTTGNVAPTIITSPDYYPDGVAIDAEGNIYISQGGSPSAGNGTYTPAIYVFPRGSVAGATPSRTIAGSNAGFAIYAYEIFVDSGGNIFVEVTLNGQNDFLVFSATANGNVAPASMITRAKGATTDFQFYIR